jgi:hypothetical protein
MLTPYNEDFETQMAQARRIMKKRRKVCASWPSELGLAGRSGAACRA